MRHAEFISRPMNSRKILACEINAACYRGILIARRKIRSSVKVFIDRRNVCLRNVFISISIYEVCLQQIIMYAHYKIGSATQRDRSTIRFASREMQDEITTSCKGKKI